MKESLARLEWEVIGVVMKAILKLMEPDKFARILDLGCYDRNFSLELGTKVGTPELYRVDIVDITAQ